MFSHGLEEILVHGIVGAGWETGDMETYSRVAVVVLGFLLATAAGTPVVRGFFRLVDWQTRR